MTKIIKMCLISGSERSGGNTNKVMEYIKKNFSQEKIEINSIYLTKQNIHPCGSCGDCNYKKDTCHIDDDMHEIVSTLINSDILIYLVPVHAFGMAHPMQIFLERAGVGFLRFKRPLANKIGGCIIIGRRYNLGNAHDQILNNLLLNRLIIPGAGYPALVQGGKSGDVMNDTEGLSSVDMLIRRLLDVASILKGTNFKNFDNERNMIEKRLNNSKNRGHND